MSKRFTETNKWSDPWFRTLTVREKTLWSWMCDNCDVGGVLNEIDWGLLSFQIGDTFTEEDLKNFKSRIEPCGKGFWIKSFVGFQSGFIQADTKSAPHRGILKALNRSGITLEKAMQGVAKPIDSVSVGYSNPSESLSLPLPKASTSLKDKDKDKDLGLGIVIKDTPCPKSASPTSDGERFVTWFLDLLAETDAPTPKLTPSNRASWADCYEKMIRIDGRTKEQVKEICAWARNDAFWRKNFLSPAKLREKKDGVMWFDAFLSKMGSDNTHAPNVARPDIYVEPPRWRERAAALWPEMQMPATWGELSATVRNALISSK